jgi:hypothetical protein
MGKIVMLLRVIGQNKRFPIWANSMIVSKKSCGNWNMRAVRSKAASLGLRVHYVRKVFGSRHIQDRLYINGWKCQLLSLVNPSPTVDKESAIAKIRVPLSAWAEFLIYVPGPLSDSQPFLIIPRDRLLESTSRNADQLLPYADGWHFLSQSSKRMPKHAATTPVYPAANSEKSLARA